MHEFTCQNIDQSEHDQNHDQAKRKCLKKFFQKFSLKFMSHAVYVWESLPLSYPHSLYKQTGEVGVSMLTSLPNLPALIGFQ